MENSKSKDLLVLLIVLSLLVIVLTLGYVTYNKLFNTKDNTNSGENYSNNNDKNDEKNIENLDISSQIVKDVMSRYNDLYISEDNLYKNNEYSISSITDYDLVSTALSNVDTNKIAYCIWEESQLKDDVSIDELNSILDDLLYNKDISISTIKSSSEEVSYPIADYQINNIGIVLSDNGLKLIGPCDGGYGFIKYTDKKIIKAEKNDDYLFVYEKQAFGEDYMEDNNDKFLTNYYKDYARTAILEKGLIRDADNPTPNWDLYNTYKYTFKNIDGEYFFESLELVNE